jgi:hypothetical protein
MNLILVTALIRQNFKDILTPDASARYMACLGLIRHGLQICDKESDSFDLIHHC